MGHKLHHRIEVWKKLLLDFGKKNRLINFKDGKRSNVHIVSPSYEAVRPKDAYAYNNRGYVYINTNELDLARDDFDRAIELCPDNPEYFDSRADLFIVLKEYEKALEDVKVGLSLKPSENIHKLLMEKKRTV